VAINNHIHQAQTAKPTRTSTPTRIPTNGPTEWAYVTQTQESHNLERTATRVAYLITMMAPVTETVIARDATATALALTPSLTPTPTLPVTPMSPKRYYVLNDSFGLQCPHTSCKPAHSFVRGMNVLVVGIVDGDFNQPQTNKWYVIAFPHGNTTVYEYWYEEWLSLVPPENNIYPTLDPNINYDATSTPVPTPSHDL
jgi:hypothetical protein